MHILQCTFNVLFTNCKHITTYFLNIINICTVFDSNGSRSIFFVDITAQQGHSQCPLVEMGSTTSLFIS